MTDMLSCLLLLHAVSGVTSLTVISRRVQNQSPGTYRYAPEVYVKSGFHRVTAPPSPSTPLRIPKYRSKYRYHVKSVRPVVLVAQRPPKKYHEPLPTLVSNELDETREEIEKETDFPPVNIDEGGSFPSFGKESPYLKLRKPEWSTPSPVTDTAFTPIQMYLQIRQSNQVKHVPQSEALKDATTLEEVVNAPRLKELLRTTRVREVYSEEGYEDAGYDHGGHIRHAEHDEGYVAQDEGKFKLKESVEDEDYTIPERSRKKETRRMPDETVAQESKSEPRISTVEFATLPSKYKGEHKYSSKIKMRQEDKKPSTEASGFWAMPTVFDGLPSPTSPMGFEVFTMADATTPRSKYIKIIASEEPGKSNQSQTETKKSRKSFKYSPLHAKYPKRDRFRLAKLNQSTLDAEEADAEDKRIILPTIGYINSLTTAHFGKNKSNHVSNNNLITTPLNLTQALNYLRSNRQQPKMKTAHRRVIDDGMYVHKFEPKRLKNRNRRDLYEGPDDGEKIHEAKDEEIAEEEERITAERERYEKELTDELDREEKEILRATLGRYEPPEGTLEKLREAYGEEPTEATSDEEVTPTTPKPVDTSKYPFYFSRNVHEDSPLRYATNPKNFPRKRGKEMVFYESRDKLVQCPEVRPDLSDIPKKNATLDTEDGERKRLAGLGDKIACLRMKYFDEDPLDNPLFKETEVDYVGKSKIQAEETETQRKSRTPVQEKENFRYHSSYQYQPNRTLHIMVKGGSEKNITERVIPVTEEVDETPVQEKGDIPGLTPPPLRRRIIRPTYRPFLPVSDIPARKVPIQSKLIIPHNCMHVITKMAALDGHKNLIIDCNDGMLIQELRNDVRYLKIIPKAVERPKKNNLKRIYTSESSDWTPVTVNPRFGRKADVNATNAKQKEPRRGEVADAHSTRRRRAVPGKPGKNFPLRLSLKEFFLLLQNNNHRNPFTPKPFQLPATTLKAEESVEDEEVVKLGGQYIKGTNGREFFYIKPEPSAVGRWVVRDVAEEKRGKKPVSKPYKKYGKGKL